MGCGASSAAKRTTFFDEDPTDSSTDMFVRFLVCGPENAGKSTLLKVMGSAKNRSIEDLNKYAVIVRSNAWEFVRFLCVTIQAKQLEGMLSGEKLHTAETDFTEVTAYEILAQHCVSNRIDDQGLKDSDCSCHDSAFEHMNEQANVFLKLKEPIKVFWKASNIS